MRASLGAPTESAARAAPTLSSWRNARSRSGGPSMKAILTCIAFAAMAGTALAQAEQRPADDPLSVKPIASQAPTTDTDMIRSKIERMGYTDVVDLSRDSTGVWHARAKKGTETVEVTVDKGGRIKPGL